MPDDRDVVDRTPVAMQRISDVTSGVRDEAMMVLVGSALIGLASAVRRSA